MDYLTLVNIANLGQGLTLVLYLIGYMPQWIQMVKSKSSADVSIPAWYLWLVGSCLAWFYAWVTYMTFQVGLVLLITDSLVVAFNIVTIVLIYKYRIENGYCEVVVQSASPCKESKRPPFEA